MLPKEIELAAVQLPGRQNRISEPAATDVNRLVKEIIEDLFPILTGPFSFFGHSCGSLLAFEVARELQIQGGPTPSQVFLSAQSTPQATWERPKLQDLPPREFQMVVRRLGGFDEQLTADQEVMDELLSVVFSDFALWERRRVEYEPKLAIPITALAGQSDPQAPLETVVGWCEYTSGSFETKTFPGGHFYLDDPANNVPGFVGQALLL